MDQLSQQISQLNSSQREAVEAPFESVLVLAGAGSGKTRTLIFRMANLVLQHQVPAYAVLAVTFTNKATKEMQERLALLLSKEQLSQVWVGTFHSVAHRILRHHAEQAGLPVGFQVIDSDDQLRLVRRLHKELGLDEHHHPVKQMQHMINRYKDDGRRACHIQPMDTDTMKQQQLYQRYEQECQRSGLVDFNEILLRVHELFLNHPEVLQRYQQKWLHIHVDEFQDTNRLQYAWLRLLKDQQNNLFVVGDDDQSIYGWRGACVDNIRQFQSDFAPCRLVRLEQNYRSTKRILLASNALIDKNRDRLGKTLWTDGEPGDLIGVHRAEHEYDEARFVANQIKQAQNYQSTAILYRSNAQSRVLEDILRQENIPYRVYGGLRFFDRIEIKNALAYLRVILNLADDTALERILNTPRRGIGEKTVTQLRQFAQTRSVPMWQSILMQMDQSRVTGVAAQGLSQFIQKIQMLRQSLNQMNAVELVESLLKVTGLVSMYQAQAGLESQSRLENLQELVNAVANFASDRSQVATDIVLTEFLDAVILDTTESEQTDQSIQLMTLHAAKGLEFEHIYIVGVEEYLLPHRSATVSEVKLEEERRLMYVGMTRAEKNLLLSYAARRKVGGHDINTRPSRFLEEIPQQFKQVSGQRASSLFSASADQSRLRQSSRGVASAQRNGNGFEYEGQRYDLGTSVSHPKFGKGVITGLQGQGARGRVSVRFQSGDVKTLIVSFAKLKVA